MSFFRSANRQFSALFSILALSYVCVRPVAAYPYKVVTSSGEATYATWTEAKNALGSSPGTIELPSGTTNITGYWQMEDSQTLRGQGINASKLTLNSATGHVIVVNGKHCRIEKLTITRRTSGGSEYPITNMTSGAGVHLNASCGELYIDNCYISEHWKCFETYGGTSTQNYIINITNSTFDRAKACLLDFSNALEVHISCCLFINSLGTGMSLTNVEGGWFSNVDLCRIAGTGIYTGSAQSADLFFDHFSTDCTGSNGVKFEGVKHVNYTSGWVGSTGVYCDYETTNTSQYWDSNPPNYTFENPRTGRYKAGIEITERVDGTNHYPSEEVNISNNQILGCAGDGIWIHKSRNINISGNMIYSNSKYDYPPTNDRSGICLDQDGWDHITITGNRCGNQGTDTFQKYGVYATGTGDYLVITGNDLASRPGTVGLYDATVVPTPTTDHKIIDHNLK